MLVKIRFQPEQLKSKGIETGSRSGPKRGAPSDQERQSLRLLLEPVQQTMMYDSIIMLINPFSNDHWLSRACDLVYFSDPPSEYQIMYFLPILFRVATISRDPFRIPRRRGCG